MTNNWKLGAFLAGLAFCVSFLFGLIGGAGFGTIVLRAFLGALLFGVLGFGANVLLRRFLPELFSSANEPDNGLDITVPGVNPHDESSEDFAEGAGSPGPGGGLSADADEESDDLVEEIEELPHSEADAVSPAAGSVPASAQESSGGEEVVEDLDVLPDMGELNTSFSGAEAAESGVLAKTSYRGSEKAAALTADSSPALLAKALQTVIKRDGEG